MRWRILPVVALVLALAGCGAGGTTIAVDGGSGKDVVIHVAGNSITPAGIDHWMKVAAAADPASAHKERLLRSEAAGFLISADWLLDEASSLGVSVSDAEVKSVFNKAHPKSGELQKYLSGSHQTVSDALLRTKLELLTAKIKQKVLTDKQPGLIEKYYKENISQFSAGETRNVLMIQTNTEAQAKEAKAAIQSGQSFQSVAGRFSIEPEAKSNGGLLTAVTNGYFVEPVGKAVEDAKKGVLTGPIGGGGLYWLFKVLSTTGGTRQTLKQAEPKIKQQIAATSQESTSEEFAAEFKKKWTAKTDCHAGYVVADCRQYKAATKVG